MELLKNKIKEYKNGKEYSKKDLKDFVMGYVNNIIDDSIMTDFIKSIFEKPLSIEATSSLTEIMMLSGDVIDLSDIPGIKVDKHSTGGVGDKVTLIVAPIVASLGAKVAKMSGRGLGFTGGTLDKLESIPGYNIFLSDEEFKNNVKKYNIAVMGQTKNLVPADKKIYALRDETNLIASMPLISSSIMSKKLATGADAILIDVKVGDAAFMKTQKDGEELASWMINIGKSMGREVKVEITSMDTPLGYEIGNKNEVLEAVSFLKGEKPAKDLEEVIFSSASTMLVQSKIFEKEEEALIAVKQVIKNGKAFEKFQKWISTQGGDVESIFKDTFWNPKHSFTIKSNTSGFFNITSAINFGLLAMNLGAGREKKEDDIDVEAGISLHIKSGDKVENGESLFTLYSSNAIEEEHINYLNNSFEITNSKKTKKIILNKL